MKKAIVILVLLWAGGTWFVGGWAQRELTHQLSQLETATHAMLSAEIISYDKGWLKSSAVTSWTIRNGGDGAGEVIRFAHTISHGPNPLFGWARITTEPILPEQMARVAADLWNEAPVTVVTKVGFNGTRTLEINSPKTSARPHGTPGTPGSSQTTVNWEGMTGTGEFTGNGGRMEVSVPGLTIEHPAMGEVRLSSLYFNTNGAREEGSALWTGDTETGWEEIFLDARGMMTFQMGKTVLTGGNQIAPDGTVSGYIKSSIDGLSRSGFGTDLDLKRVQLAASLSNLDRQGMESLAVAMRDAAGEKAEAVPAAGPRQPVDMSGRPAADPGTEAFSSILKGSPVLEVESLRVESDLGELDASARLAFNGNGFVLRKAASIAEPLSRVNLSLNAQVGEALLETVLMWKSMSTATASQMDPDEAEELARRTAKGKIAGMVSKRLLLPRGESYSLSMTMKDTILFINGHPADGSMGQVLGKLIGGV